MIPLMGVTSGAKGRGGPPTPAVVGIGRSMRARDVSRPRPENIEAAKKKAQDGKGGSSPVAS
ncbi:hypothetical protein GCM10009744_11850 [Kribbella alba]|uniref:Uncharacterized protein n=1 Tax=Kribbella alba TaxID=190197 RepID=A0ABP4QWS4_9ACTN